MDRAEISRRLKAARWLAGGVDDRGRPTPVSPEDLALREPLQRNGITANAISEIERLIKDARPMELREIAAALDLPPSWFDAAAPPWVGAPVITGRQLQAMMDVLSKAVAAGDLTLDDARLEITPVIEEEDVPPTQRVSARASAAADRLGGSPTTGPSTPRAVGDEGPAR